MDVIALTIRRNSRKPQLVRNSKTSIHMSVQKISPTRYCAVILFLLIYFYFCEFQIVLQEHNYGADSYTSGAFPVSHLKCGEYGDLNPRLFAMSAQTGQANKTNNGVCCGSPVVNA